MATENALKRPGTITLLAILQCIPAVLWLFAGLVCVGVGLVNYRDNAALIIVPLGIALIALGSLSLVCGIGLWRLRSYGRTIQLVFAWIGLIGFPIGTIISVLILVYLFKPGLKLLFSERPADSFTPEEEQQIATDTKSSAVIIVIVVAVLALFFIAIIGIIAAIAIPGLLRARMSGNEASAIGSLRAINSGEAAYSSSCGANGYAASLEDLVRPPRGQSLGFVSEDLSRTDIERSGYRIRIERDRGATDVAPAADTCNGTTSVSSYFASVEPVAPGTTGARYFATDTRGTIYYSDRPIANPIVDSAAVRVLP